MNPTLWHNQSLLINSVTNESDLDILLDSCEEYMINHNNAEKIISEVKSAVAKWREVAVSLGIAKREIDMFEQIYRAY